MPYNGEFHFTALRTLGTQRTMSASSRRATSRFQPGIAAMYACTGASPSAFAICGLPPDSKTAPLEAGAPAFGLGLVAGLRGGRARDALSAFGFAWLGRDVPLAFGLVLPADRRESMETSLSTPSSIAPLAKDRNRR